MKRLRAALAAFPLAILLASQACGHASAGAEEGDSLAAAYSTIARWTDGAYGPTGAWGEGATLTWSIVPDGTWIPAYYSFEGETASGSDLVAFLDGLFGGPQTGLPAEHSWFSLVQSAFDRWESVSGIDFVYEPLDDGVDLTGSFPGVAGMRGDVRLSGHLIDGAPVDGDGMMLPNILAYSFFPPRGNLVLDTANADVFGNDGGDYLRLRNTLTHELGHALGLGHVDGDSDPLTPGNQPGTMLMEPALATTFDGPQLDDILGIHRLYGDRNESSGGNDSWMQATPLGSLAPEGPALSLGGDAVSGVVAPTEVDFVSVDDLLDVDVFSLLVEGPGRLSIELKPSSATYWEVDSTGLPAIVDWSSVGDLHFDVLAADGMTVLASASQTSLGESEAIHFLPINGPGTIYVRVSASTLSPQFYQMRVELAAVPEPTSGLLAGCLGMTLLARRRASRSLSDRPFRR